MATLPTAPVANKFDWKTLIPILEMGINIGTLAIPGGAAFGPLEAAIEQAVNPLLMSIGTHQSTSTAVLAVYGAFIGILNGLKSQTNLPPEVLNKVTEYIAAVQDATTAWMKASQGLDLSVFTPVEPIS